jgi:hypothetical protein
MAHENGDVTDEPVYTCPTTGYKWWTKEEHDERCPCEGLGRPVGDSFGG